jgi:sulfate transport system substrate-binding protein
VSGNTATISLPAFAGRLASSVAAHNSPPEDTPTNIPSSATNAKAARLACAAARVAFSVEKQGDVQIAWENEALRDVAESNGKVEIVYPPTSILAEPAVAWVDANVAKHNSAGLSKAYLEFLFSDEAQDIIAREGYRPVNKAVAARHADRLSPLNLFPITLIAKDWADAEQKFFAENGLIDVIYVPTGNCGSTD